jgi:hypothetical protein
MFDKVIKVIEGWTGPGRRDLVQTGVKDAIDLAIGLPIAGFGSEANEIFGPACSNYHTWLKRIKTALDPQMACDSFFYVVGTQNERKENPD